MGDQILSSFVGRANVSGEDNTTLDDVFQREVFENKHLAWYVDFFTENPHMYDVRYLCDNPHINVTDENIEHRDGDDIWGSEDVARWFRDDAGVYRMVIRFQTKDGEAHTLSLSPATADLDGNDFWDRYVVLGIRGALLDYADAFDHLVSIETIRL